MITAAELAEAARILREHAQWLLNGDLCDCDYDFAKASQACEAGAESIERDAERQRSECVITDRGAIAAGVRTCSRCENVIPYLDSYVVRFKSLGGTCLVTPVCHHCYQHLIREDQEHAAAERQQSQCPPPQEPRP